MATIKLGSLFDGIGGFPLAGQSNGIEPVWASEIEPFPIRVTQQRFPGMKHYGDITKMNGAELDPVDVITGGSPCQDLSIAGKRAGLEGARSGLFIEQIRIIKEARAKYGKPRFMVWENVPGAFSSNDGEDFRAILEETAAVAESGISIPRPENGKWATAGSILADGWSLAWRTLDAQFWGVPQRRRRIFLVADFRGQSAPEILFERKSVSGDIAEGGEAWQGAAEGAESGAGKASSFEPGAITRNMGTRHWEEVAPALRAEAGDNQPAIYQTPAITLQMRDGKAGGGKGPLTQIEQSATLGTGNTQVAFTPRSVDCRNLYTNYELSGTLQSNSSLNYQNPVITGTYSFQRSDELKTSDISHTLSRRDYKDATDLIATPLAVRRLTPLECERLQGFPDGWTDIEGASDSARYKALGNSVAIPCVKFVLQGIAAEITKGEKEMARLRWLIVDESSGKVLDREKIENCEECPNADHKRMVCRKQGGSFLRANYAFPSYCPLGIQGEAGGQD